MMKKTIQKTSFICLLFLCLTAQSVFGQSSRNALVKPQTGAHGMVVTGQKLATQAGLEVLKAGGNAVDAAVTVGFVLAVTLPSGGNIGGGGFMLIYEAKNQTVLALDYREKAPAKAYRDMFLDKKGNVLNQLSRFSHRSAGVPGTVAGLAMALNQFGTISLAEALAPAIKYAEDGFIINEALAAALKRSGERLQNHTATKKIFFKPDGGFYEKGDRLIQEDLSRTLKRIAALGPDDFYTGKTADLIAHQMALNNGLITKKDLATYQPTLRKPASGVYRNYGIFSMSPPSSGGVHITQILNILEGFDIRKSGHNSAETIHLMAEAMKRAYADRSEYLGDPDFVSVPVKGLTSKAYAAKLRQEIQPGKASNSSQIRPGNPLSFESDETTHYSVADKYGNAVSNTYTINFGFGSGIVVEGAGFLLNNEMDDFSAKPGVPNAYGLIGGDANAIEPNKRMLSSMSPTIVLKEGKVFLVTGSPGGSRIITTTLQIIMNVIDHQMNIQEAVNAVRIHHQWLPDEIRVEKGLSIDTTQILEKWGHKVVEKWPMGAASSIRFDPATKMFFGAADPRQEGLALGF